MIGFGVVETLLIVLFASLVLAIIIIVLRYISRK